MKLMSEIAKKIMPEQEIKLIHAIRDVFIIKYLKEPIFSNEAICPMCNGNKGYTCLIDPQSSDQRVWFCLNGVCLTAMRRSTYKTYQPTTQAKRSLEWPLFCEINQMGDLVHDTKFEKIEQSKPKIEYLLKFSKNPTGIILMQGESGTGKTYAAMGLCELFTRTSQSCRFFTQERLIKDWLESKNLLNPSTFIDKINNVSLLVIDDFGLRDCTPAFLDLFMSIINTRMQWSNRGTVITTNLNEKKISEFCGEALTDRINTGQKFEFKDKSRRKPTII